MNDTHSNNQFSEISHKQSQWLNNKLWTILYSSFSGL